MTKTQVAIDEGLEAAAHLQDLIDSVALTKSVVGTTGVQRKAGHQAAIEAADEDALGDLRERLASAIEHILANTIDLDDLGLRTQDELRDLMMEFLDERDVVELLTVRREMLKAAVFAHITELHKLKGTPAPDTVPGEAPVPDLGMKFVKQRQGKARLNESLLAEKLGAERWEQVRKAVHVPAVPAHIEYHLDHDAMMKLVVDDPAVMEVFRECVIPGTLAFHVREIQSE